MVHTLRLYGLPHLSRGSKSPKPPSPMLVACTTSTSSEVEHSTSTTEQSFTHAIEPMPSPGPAHYEARRALWLTAPAAASEVRPTSPSLSSPSTSRKKLEALLSQDTEGSDAVWNAGLKNVWKGLVGGGRLRRRLPLALVIKILKAGWQHDGTWPADSVTGPSSPAPSTETLPLTTGDNDIIPSL